VIVSRLSFSLNHNCEPAWNLCLFTAFYCMVYCSFILNVWMYVCARIENDLVEEPEELAGEAPEQQSVGGGKCPLTYLCPIHSLIHLPHFTVIPKD
jgi:hypothetical protein